jgi:hypothetical protein
MARDARLTALRRPTPVAVHDNGYVARQARPVNLRQQRLVARAALDYICEVREHPTLLELKTPPRILIANHFKVQSGFFIRIEPRRA